MMGVAAASPVSDTTPASVAENASVSLTADSTPREAAADLAALPGQRRDHIPAGLLVVVMLVALPFIGSAPTWVTLTVAGLAMGMMLFIMASGLTLVFGLMDVLNLGHAAFVAVGAYVASSLVVPLSALMQGGTGAALLGMGLVALGSMAVTAVLGWVFERIFIRPVYGDHMKQILITIGAMIILEQLVLGIWGAQQMTLPLPEPVRGSFVIDDVAIERYRLVAVSVGLVLYVGLTLLMNRTRIGLLIRAGVENREMVEALGYRVRRLFVGVFVAGAALAGLGGAMWGFYREQFTSAIGAEVLVQMLIIVIIGGLGSVSGCFVGALLLALLQNYVSFLQPDLALVSNILVMVAVLLWRPRGLYPVNR